MMWGFGHSGVQKGRIAHRDRGSGPCGVHRMEMAAQKAGVAGGEGASGYPASLGNGAAAAILHRLGTAVQKTGIFEGLAYFMYSASFSSAASASFTPPFLALAK